MANLSPEMLERGAISRNAPQEQRYFIARGGSEKKNNGWGIIWLASSSWGRGKKPQQLRDA
jgi:hypothetical protein